MLLKSFSIALLFSSLTYANNLAQESADESFHYTPPIAPTTPYDQEALTISQAEITKQRLGILSTLIRQIRESYAPLEYKKALKIYDGIDALEAEFIKKVQVLSLNQDRQFETLMVDLVSRLNDGHVRLKLKSDYVRKFPFQMIHLDNKYYINWISGKFPSDKVRKPELMDEVIEIEKMPVDEFRKSFSPNKAQGNGHTNRSDFALNIGNFYESFGYPVQDMKPSGLTLTLISQSQKEKYEITVPYEESGTPFINRNSSVILRKSKKNKEDPEEIPEGQIPLRSEEEKQEPTLPGEGKKILFGKESLFTLPAGAQEIEFPTNETIRAYEKNSSHPDTFNRSFLKAYIYSVSLNGETKRVGFLRVPNYTPPNNDTFIYRLRHIIAVLNQRTDVLIVDQLNNTGGRVSAGVDLVQSLTPNLDPNKEMNFLFRPQRIDLEFNQKITEEFIMNEKEIKRAIGEERYTEILKSLEINNRHLSNAYNSPGKFSLSEPVSRTSFYKASRVIQDAILIKKDNLLYGALQSTGRGDVFLNHQAYSADKPIYFLINELDFSGGDAVPAELQDQGRAKIVGIGATQTAGAGGTVKLFEISGLGTLSLTTSLMQRPERMRQGDLVRRFVENVGVKADVVIPVTLKDYTTGFNRVLVKIHKLIGEDFHNQKSTASEKLSK